MNDANPLSTQLQYMSDFKEAQTSADENLCDLAMLAAKILSAENCAFIWATGEDWAQGSPGSDVVDSRAVIGHEAIRKQVLTDGVSMLVDVSLESDGAMTKRGQAANALLSPIKTGGSIIGAVHISGPTNKSRFDLHDLRLLDIVTLFIGKSMQIVQLQNVLKSRFAQMALAQNADEAVVPSVPPPAQMAKILAKSFYREMTKAGFGADQIINAASQIISELTKNLHKHSKRSRGNASPPRVSGRAGGMLVPAAASQ
jgi:hypothetical protein